MTTLSPSAERFIGLALDQFGEPRHKTQWAAWTASPSRELVPHLAQIALHALSGLALQLEDRIGDEATPPQLAAEMENDLAFVADIEELLLEQLRQPIRAYG